jgi:hypothetical protein
VYVFRYRGFDGVVGSAGADDDDDDDDSSASKFNANDIQQIDLSLNRERVKVVKE